MTEAKPELFDRALRRARRDRAARTGPDMFLLDAIFDETIDRLADVRRGFERALLIGAPSPSWPVRLAAVAGMVDVIEPGPLFAAAAGGAAGDEDRFDYGEARFDLAVAVGTLDTVNELGPALARLRRALRPDSPLIGAMAGGDSLNRLRAAMIEADRATGGVAQRTHPRIDPASLAALLSAAGFVMPVVDVERQRLRYGSMFDLVRDLRAMGAGNSLTERAPGRGRAWAALAAAAFAGSTSGRTEERIDVLHFIGWTPPESK